MFRLTRGARLRCLGTDYGPDDLLQEAIRRILDGQRTVPSDQPFVACLMQVMRSIAWASRKRLRAVAKEAELVQMEDTVPSPTPTPEQEAASNDACARLNEVIVDMFGDDDEAQAVLMGRVDGMTPAEIKAAFGMNQTTYDTALRRIRRRVAKHFPKGWKP
ncbi:RNA polymerase sigma factor [Magnetospirillum molischianum]|uniref:RNA polymerase sigma factor n=1 Tax=Magnetospirillum molischianum TaxID=1083 RepID=UPI00138AEDDD|nr:hypothetical protein [Magnetospirillum molischianum]